MLICNLLKRKIKINFRIIYNNQIIIFLNKVIQIKKIIWDTPNSLNTLNIHPNFKILLKTIQRKKILRVF